MVGVQFLIACMLEYCCQEEITKCSGLRFVFFLLTARTVELCFIVLLQDNWTGRDCYTGNDSAQRR